MLVLKLTTPLDILIGRREPRWEALLETKFKALMSSLQRQTDIKCLVTLILETQLTLKTLLEKFQSLHLGLNRKSSHQASTCPAQELTRQILTPWINKISLTGLALMWEEICQFAMLKCTLVLDTTSTTKRTKALILDSRKTRKKRRSSKPTTQVLTRTRSKPALASSRTGTTSKQTLGL